LLSYNATLQGHAPPHPFFRRIKRKREREKGNLYIYIKSSENKKFDSLAKQVQGYFALSGKETLIYQRKTLT
jgi:hypothetical protein